MLNHWNLCLNSLMQAVIQGSYKFFSYGVDNMNKYSYICLLELLKNSLGHFRFILANREFWQCSCHFSCFLCMHISQYGTEVKSTHSSEDFVCCTSASFSCPSPCQGSSTHVAVSSSLSESCFSCLSLEGEITGAIVGTLETKCYKYEITISLCS